MNWKYKALLQSAFSVLPEGETLNYLFQRYVTKSLPSGERAVYRLVMKAKRHITSLQRHLYHPIEELAFYEFGAGCDLIIPLTYYSLGVKRQVVVDIRKLVRPGLVNDTVRKL